MNRRKFLTGLIAAPAIVRIDSIMPVRKIPVQISLNAGVSFVDLTPETYRQFQEKCFVDLICYGNEQVLIRPYQIIRIPPDQWSNYDIR